MTANVDVQEEYPVARKLHLDRWVLAVIILVAAAWLVRSLTTNSNLGWPIIGQYLFDRTIMRGLATTIYLAVLCQVMSMVLGVIIAIAARSSNPILRGGAAVYIWFFRATPLLVQLIFWYNLALLFPNLSFGVPFTGQSWSWSMNSLITGFSAAVLGLTLNSAGYMAEIIRGGLLAVPRGQEEAAQSIGMRRLRVLTRVTLPQAVRWMIPPTGNQFINVIKETSLVSVIGGGDLLTNAQNIYAQNFAVISLLMVVTFWYLVVMAILTFGQSRLERWVAKDTPAVRRTPTFSRLKTAVRPREPA